MNLPTPEARRRRKTGWVGVLLLLLVSTRTGAEQPWTIHEWGTFTSLQDEAGNAIGGINTDDEPVPKFVHRLADFLLLSPTDVPRTFFQGAPSCHPDVTLRLETPVIYFHPPLSETNVGSVDVRVRFHGGWLTEFFPNAGAEAPGLTTNGFQFGRLPATTVSSLTWTNLEIGGASRGPETDAHVWTSPRAVQAASVQTTHGESEKFLFYRGVAHIDAPVRIVRDSKNGLLAFHSQLDPAFRTNEPLKIQSLWLVDIRSGGKVAFRTLPPLTLETDPDIILTETPASFGPGDYRQGNLKKLRDSLREALVAEGLFGDEADALLNTWELSYFQSSGLRAFFLVPRAWTDFYLPLELSAPADIRRVMVGRVELVTPEQRRSLEEIAGLPKAGIVAEAVRLRTDFYTRIGGATNAAGPVELAQVEAGRKPLASWVAVPKSYQTYLDLGRFRNALILDQAKRHPAAGLTNFILAYGLQAYPVPPISGNF